jgi:hypothetical protein
MTYQVTCHFPFITNFLLSFNANNRTPWRLYPHLIRPQTPGLSGLTGGRPGVWRKPCASGEPSSFPPSWRSAWPGRRWLAPHCLRRPRTCPWFTPTHTALIQAALTPSITVEGGRRGIGRARFEANPCRADPSVSPGAATGHGWLRRSGLIMNGARLIPGN